MDYVEKVRGLNKLADSPALAYVDVYGCQQNEADGERLRGLLADMGYAMAADPLTADVLIVNTCAIREHAQQKVLGKLGALLHTRKPGQLMAVCGCMAQQPEVQEKLRRSYPQVGLVFGPALIPKLPEMLYRALTDNDSRDRGRHFYLSDPTAPIEENLPVLRGGPPRAWITIMTGCDNFCTYCIVPHVRGRERSREPDAILDEARRLVAEGYTELFLLGQNVNSYAPQSREIPDFPSLLTALNALEGDFTIRFMTSHPKDAGRALPDAMAACRKVARILHLPFQSGSDAILGRMNRRYTSSHYIELVDYARSVMPGLKLTSDVIVGFPGETEADYNATLELIRRVRFDGLFIFIYSPRPGTPAEKLPDDTPREEKVRRLQQLAELQRGIEAEKAAQGI